MEPQMMPPTPPVIPPTPRKSRRTLISIIILGMIILVGALYYWGFFAKDNTPADPKKAMTEQVLTQNAGALELYKTRTGKYPTSLTLMQKAGYQIWPQDPYLQSFYYKVSEDGLSYDLRSLGQDGEYNTPDDIFPTK